MIRSLAQVRTKALRNPKTKAAYDALGPEYEMSRTIIKHRLDKGWSQADLAKAIGTKQPVISRLERGHANPSLETLRKVAEALELSLHISLR